MTIEEAFDLVGDIHGNYKGKTWEAIDMLGELAWAFNAVREILGLGYDNHEHKIYIKRKDTPTNSEVKTWYDADCFYSTITAALQDCFDSDVEEHAKDEDENEYKE